MGSRRRASVPGSRGHNIMMPKTKSVTRRPRDKGGNASSMRSRDTEVAHAKQANSAKLSLRVAARLEACVLIKVKGPLRL